MNKILLLLTLSLLLNACKQKDSTPQNSPKEKKQPLLEVTDCAIFEILGSLTTREQLIWLRANQTEICLPEFDTCREEAHRLSQRDYDAAVLEYWKGKPAVYTAYTFSDIKALTTQTGYERFIITSLNGDTVKLRAGPDFTKAAAAICFSIPLFYSIERVYRLDEKDELLFTRAIVDGNETIVFYLKGTNHFYDVGNLPL